MEFVQLTDKTYYIKNHTNIGIYKIDDENVYLVDSGNDKDCGKKILKILDENHLKVKGIINTHSHADHIGGNKIIQDRTQCDIYAYRIEKCFTEYPILESSFLYGGYPFRELKNKFLLAKGSKGSDIEISLLDGLEFFPLKGHSFDMIGLKTKDDIYFLADALASEEAIKKYHVFLLYDVKEYFNTLDFLSNLKGKKYILSHTEELTDLSHLIDLNRKKMIEIMDKIYQFCEKNRTFEEILKEIFDSYHLVMDSNQYLLVGSTIRSYLSYLYEEGKLSYQCEKNRMTWKQIK